MKARDIDTIFKKLDMQIHDGKHRHAYFVHKGVTVVKTKRSHGNNKFIPEHLIRRQLHVDQDQFRGLHSCTVSKDDYVKILTDKGVI